jgi:hypothetical protein
MLLFAMFYGPLFAYGPNQGFEGDVSDLDRLKRARIAEMGVVAEELKETIEARDCQKLLDYFLTSPTIGFGPGDAEFTRKEVQKQFEARYGLVFCAVFDTPCFRQTSRGTLAESAHSVYEDLTTRAVTVEIYAYEDVTVTERLWKLGYGRIAFRWEEEPLESGRLMYPEFHFRRRDDGTWRIVKISVE